MGSLAIDFYAKVKASLPTFLSDGATEAVGLL
jgi:hypothetical protein